MKNDEVSGRYAMGVGCSVVGAMMLIYGLIYLIKGETVPGLFVSGIILLPIGVGLFIRDKEIPKAKEKAKKAKKLEGQIAYENKQKVLAKAEGLEKYYKMDVENARLYQEGLDAMKFVGNAYMNSVYQEKETDWAIMGGIAQGIGGVGAGMATALETMKENERIRAENAARREEAAKNMVRFQKSYREAEKERPVALTMSQIQKRFEAVMSWSPDTLFRLIKFSYEEAKIDAETGAVTVSANWSQSENTICIDGAFRAKLYTTDGKCAGCAYLVLPKEGSKARYGKISGLCAQPKASSKYTVKIEPVNLWELKDKENKASGKQNIKNDNLTIEKHRDIVKKYEENFARELAN